jgi:DNA polymerase-4
MTVASRKILHVDLDAFYASVEQRDRPELRGKPVAVAWSEEGRGVVLTASYEARPFGVRSAMPAAKARRLCPQLLFVRPDFSRYTAVSRQVREIFGRHTPLVEPLSLDEAYLDVTVDSTGLETATASAEAIRREIRAETGLTASAGAAPVKFLAKIASDWRKPDGLFVVKPQQVDAFLAPLPVRRLPGVGPATEERLAGAGIATVADLRRFERDDLAARFGRFGDRLWELARGIDPRPVEPSRPTKSVSSETTFEKDLPLADIVAVVAAQAAEVWTAALKTGRAARTVVVKLRTADFRTVTRRATPPHPPRAAEEVGCLACSLLERFGFEKQQRFRLAGVGLANFEDAREEEESLFSINARLLSS